MPYPLTRAFPTVGHVAEELKVSGNENRVLLSSDGLQRFQTRGPGRSGRRGDADMDDSMVEAYRRTGGRIAAGLVLALLRTVLDVLNVIGQ